MKIYNLNIIILIGLFTGVVNAQQPSKTAVITGGVQHSMLPWFKDSFLEIADDINEANNNNKHILLFFHLDECAYCAKMVKDFDQPFLKPFIQQYFDVIAINILGDREVAIDKNQTLTEKQLATQIGVGHTPTVIFLNQKNKIVARTNGYRRPESFKQVLSYVRDKAYAKLTLAQYIEKNKKAGNYQLQSPPMFKKIKDFSAIKNPLAIIFEDNNCNACADFYNTTLKNKAVIDEFNAFSVVRFDAGSTQAVIDNKGKQTTPKDWMQQLEINYRPGIILFNEGREIARIDGFLYDFHFKETLRYVSGGFYQNFTTYNAYLAHRQNQLLKHGIDINVGK